MAIEEKATDGQTATDRRGLVPGVFATGAVAWGMYSVLLETCKVPYPAGLPHTGTVPLFNDVAGVLALFVFCRLATPQVSALHTWQKCLDLGLLLVMLNETLRVVTNLIQRRTRPTVSNPCYIHHSWFFDHGGVKFPLCASVQAAWKT